MDMEEEEDSWDNLSDVLPTIHLPYNDRSQGYSSHDQFDPLPFIDKHIDSISSVLLIINRKIHDNPELCYKEFIAHQALVSFLLARPGWEVDSRPYGMGTAFVAVWQSEVKSEGRKKVISFNAEYDALVGIGHACGHNLIATASLAAALATRATMEEYGIAGKVVLFGTPAEEGGGGKIELLKHGAYKNQKVDVSLMAHPGNVGNAALVSTSAYAGFKVEFFGREAHAAAAPWEGINALDALIIAYNAISVLRQQTKPGSIIQGHITNGGAAPNIIHAYAAGVFVVRANTRALRAELMTKVVACFEAGAKATGATLKITPEIPYDDHSPNHALAHSYRHFRNRLPDGNIPPPDIDIVKGRSAASTDQGNISYAMPSLHSGFQIVSEFGPHNPGFAQAARSEDAHERALTTGKALAAVAIDVLTRRGFLEEVKDEFERLDKSGV